MNATKQITINYSTNETTGWKRRINFQYEGKDYEAILFWNEFDGYELYWKNDEGYMGGKTPEWAINWDEDMSEGYSLEHWLDELTFEMEK
jgi:hypothetical protein